jgi:hypothetical protein
MVLAFYNGPASRGVVPRKRAAVFGRARGPETRGTYRGAAGSLEAPFSQTDLDSFRRGRGNNHLYGTGDTTAVVCRCRNRILQPTSRSGLVFYTSSGLHPVGREKGRRYLVARGSRYLFRRRLFEADRHLLV